MFVRHRRKSREAVELQYVPRAKDRQVACVTMFNSVLCGPCGWPGLSFCAKRGRKYCHLRVHEPAIERARRVADAP